MKKILVILLVCLNWQVFGQKMFIDVNGNLSTIDGGCFADMDEYYFIEPQLSINQINILVGDSVTIYGDALTYFPIPETNLTVNYACNIGTEIGNDIVLFSDSVGEFNLNFKTYNNTGIIADDNITVRVDSLQSSTSKKVLLVGNSLTYLGVDYITDSIGGKFSVTYHGTQGTTIKHEAYPGWDWVSFMTRADSPFRKDNKLDLPAYFLDNSIDIPDIVIFRLGVNICYANSTLAGDKLTNSEAQQIIDYATTLIDSFLVLNDSLVVLISLTSISENSGAGWNANYDESIYSQNYYIENVHKLWQYYINAFDDFKYSYRVNLSYDPLYLDRDNGYPKIAGVHSNAVHPDSTGYRQLGYGTALGINKVINIPNGDVDSLEITTISDTQIDLIWHGNSTNEDGFVIERSINGSDFSIIDTNSAGDTTYSSTSLTTNIEYFYRVRAYKGIGYTAYTNIDSSFTAMKIPLVATGTGAGVATLRFLCTGSNIAMTISDNGRFYDDVGGTTNEGTSRTITAGSYNTFYLKLSSGNSNILVFHSGNLTGWGTTSNSGWIATTDAPSIYQMNIANIPSTVTDLQIAGINTMTGTFNANISHVFYVISTNTIVGNFTQLSPSLVEFTYKTESNTTANNLSDLPNGLIRFYISGTHITTGNIANIPTGVYYYYCNGGRVNEYTSGRTWATGMNYVYHAPASTYGLSSTEVDNLLIDLANTTWTGSSRTCWLAGNNAARTSASDAAVAALQAMSVTVTTN